MRQRTAKLLYWMPPVVWALVIFVMSSISFAPKPPGMFLEDKLVHAAVFGILALLIFFALFGERQLPLGKSAVLALVLTSLYGITDEIHQMFTPVRSPDIWDWAADTVGAALILGVVLFLAQCRVPQRVLRDHRQRQLNRSIGVQERKNNDRRQAFENL